MKLTKVRTSVQLLQHIARERAKLKELEDQHRPIVEEAMGEEEVGELDGKVVITWRHQKQRRLNQAALKSDHPEIVAEYTNMEERRQFVVEK